jgi:osmotically-inducible protein OsmY
MKTNADLQKDVQDAIKWEPLLNAAEIGVIARDGVVTLTGTVDSYAKKIEAETAAKSVVGVQAVAEKIEIKFSNSFKKSDTDIANDALKGFKSTWDVPDDKIKITVENGWATLEGEVPWNFQREAAKNVVKNLMGVKGVTNNIKIKPNIQDAIEQRAIEHALARNWAVDDEDIHVHVSGSKVKLDGKVHSFYQKEEAARIAWNAPGVFAVDNELVIEYD